jgi:hypothetical protein
VVILLNVVSHLLKHTFNHKFNLLLTLQQLSIVRIIFFAASVHKASKLLVNCSLKSIISVEVLLFVADDCDFVLFGNRIKLPTVINHFYFFVLFLYLFFRLINIAFRWDVTEFQETLGLSEMAIDIPILVQAAKITKSE